MLRGLPMALLLCACFPHGWVEPSIAPPGEKPSAARGRDLILNRSFLNRGVPIVLVDALEKPKFEVADDPLPPEGRRGINALTPLGYSGKWLKGVPTVAENCLLCHLGALRGEWVVGLGNSLLDATLPPETKLVREETLLGLAPTVEERVVLNEWLEYQHDVTPYSRAKTMGTVAALYFTGFFFSHRGATDFSWGPSQYEMLKTPPPETDIPPWWQLKKKKALYYGGELTGDYRRALMQFMSPPGNSFEDLKAAERDFEDVLAFLNALEAPKFPQPVDSKLVAEGRAVFVENCGSCHGSYGPGGHYPTKVVPIEKVGTDKARWEFMQKLGFAQHYGKTWYGEHSKLAATDGYVAPPLDGVWATAPYLHNGSVPTLEALLDPSLRPTYFERPRDSSAYDLDAVGWKFRTLDHGQDQEPDSDKRRDLWDTTLYGHGNQGHTFGAPLSKQERRAVLEYLKTL